MRDDKTLLSNKKMFMTKLLIFSNLLMLVVGIITIPPNLQKKDKTQVFPSTNEIDSNISNPKYESLIEEVHDLNFTTVERPDLEDFLWYTEDVFYEGVPSNVAIIDNVKYAIGGWKGLIIYDPNNEFGENALEFLNVNIEGMEDNLSLTLDWYLMFIAGVGSSFDETDMEDSVFKGKWQDDGLWASGSGTVRITQFYELNNRQYAVGTMDTPDGIPAFVALVRP